MIQVDAFATSSLSNGGVDWSDVLGWELRYSFFLGDIRLISADVDFSTHWGWVPVLDFALSFISLLEPADGAERRVFEFTESEAAIWLEVDGEMAVLTASYSPGVMRLHVAELDAAVRDLASRLTSRIASENPKITENPHFVKMLSDAGIE